MHPDEHEYIEEQARVQREQTEHSAATQAGMAQAQEGAIDLSRLRDGDIIEDFADPDIGRDDGDLEEMLEAEFGRHLVFGNIPEDEWEKQKLLDRARSRLAKCEFPREGRIGSRCRGVVRQIMVPDEDERPVLTDDRAREIDAAFEERSLARSLSINAKGFDGVTAAIVETRNRREETNNSGSGGLVSRTVGRLFG